MEDQINNLRHQIDILALLTKELKPLFGCNLKDCTTCDRINSKEIEKALDSLYLTKAWLGEVLDELGLEVVDNIYPKDLLIEEEGKLVKAFPDYFGGFGGNSFDGNWKDLSHVVRVGYLGKEIKKINQLITDTLVDNNKGRFFTHKLLYYNIYTHLTQAEFWLGFELERIKNEK